MAKPKIIRTPSGNNPFLRHKWKFAAVAGALTLGTFAVMNMDDDNASPRVDPAASSGATPINPADPAPVDPASPPPPPAQPSAPPPVTTFYNIGANARPTPLFTTESPTSAVIGYIGGCFSTTDATGEIREIKINTPEGERTGHINVRGARPGTIVRDPDMSAAECAGTITAAKDVPITEDYYRMAAGSNILYTPRDGARVKEHFELSVCLRIVDAVNSNGTPYAAVILSVPGRRTPVAGWAWNNTLTIDAGCIPQTP